MNHQIDALGIPNESQPMAVGMRRSNWVSVSQK
jgi:hypothetical protein